MLKPYPAVLRAQFAVLLRGYLRPNVMEPKRAERLAKLAATEPAINCKHLPAAIWIHSSVEGGVTRAAGIKACNHHSAAIGHVGAEHLMSSATIWLRLEIARLVHLGRWARCATLLVFLAIVESGSLKVG